MLNSYGVVYMARIQDVEVGNSSKGYERVFNNKDLGELFTKVHSAAIRNGYELESILTDRFQNDRIDDLDSFINSISNQAEGMWFCPKNVLKKSNYNVKGIEPDFLFFDTRNGEKNCFSVEIKDGNAFDTKKSKGEIKNMVSFCKKFLKDYNKVHNNDGLFITKNFYFCCFNENDHNRLNNAFRGYVSDVHLLTGTAFCEKVGINDYDEIVESRKEDGDPNIDYFISELLKINKAKEKIVEKTDLKSACTVIFDYEINLCIESGINKNIRFEKLDYQWFKLLSDLRQYDLYFYFLKRGSDAGIEAAHIGYCEYLLRGKYFSETGIGWTFDESDFGEINRVLTNLFSTTYRQDLIENIAAKTVRRLYDSFGKIDIYPNIINYLRKNGKTIIVESEDLFVLDKKSGQRFKINDL